MEYTITRLEDPHPGTGARLYPANAWAARPPSMKDDNVFCMEPDGTMSVVTSIRNVEDESMVILTIDGKEVPVDYGKYIYVTEFQLEQIIEYNSKRMLADLESKDVPEEAKKMAKQYIKQAASMELSVPDQYELRVSGHSDLVNLRPCAWMLAGKDGTRVDFANIETKDPFGEDAERALRLSSAADFLYTENAPHKWKVLFG